MQPDARLCEALAAKLLLRLVDSDTGAATDTVELGIGLAHYERQAQKRQQLLVKGYAGLVIADRQHHVGNPIDFHRVTSVTLARRLQPDAISFLPQANLCYRSCA
jgi:hypothetical protein